MRNSPSNHKLARALFAVGWVALSGAAVGAGVINCWKNITKNCCELIGGGMTPNLDRRCGETLCPDTIVSNPAVNHTAFGPDPGYHDTKPGDECLCKWRWRYCNAFNECITTDTYYSNFGIPSEATGDPCDPNG